MFFALALSVSPLQSTCETRLEDVVIALEKINGRQEIVVTEKYKDPAADLYQVRIQSSPVVGGVLEDGAYYLRIKNDDPAECQVVFVEKFL